LFLPLTTKSPPGLFSYSPILLRVSRRLLFLFLCILMGVLSKKIKKGFCSLNFITLYFFNFLHFSSLIKILIEKTKKLKKVAKFYEIATTSSIQLWDWFFWTWNIPTMLKLAFFEARNAYTDLFSLPSPLHFVATGLRTIQFLFRAAVKDQFNYKKFGSDLECK
jgi:hypothetical protein